jgi:hypothetical protein
MSAVILKAIVNFIMGTWESFLWIFMKILVEMLYDTCMHWVMDVTLVSTITSHIDNQTPLPFH